MKITCFRGKVVFKSQIFLKMTSVNMLNINLHMDVGSK